MHPHVDPSTAMYVLSALLGGIALASACGLRAFLPLLALSLAARAGLVHLSARAGWIAGDPALWTFAVATVLELAADKIPIVDHVLDAVATVVRPAAAAVAGWAALGTVDPRLAAMAAVVLGGGALGVHVLKAKARLGSTALTLGHANPLLSIGEDIAAAALSAVAFLAPLLVLVLLAAVLLWLLAPRRGAR